MKWSNDKPEKSERFFMDGQETEARSLAWSRTRPSKQVASRAVRMHSEHFSFRKIVVVSRAGRA